jgi:hypothetical protein
VAGKLVLETRGKANLLATRSNGHILSKEGNLSMAVLLLSFAGFVPKKVFFDFED